MLVIKYDIRKLIYNVTCSCFSIVLFLACVLPSSMDIFLSLACTSSSSTFNCWTSDSTTVSLATSLDSLSNSVNSLEFSSPRSKEKKSNSEIYYSKCHVYKKHKVRIMEAHSAIH